MPRFSLMQEMQCSPILSVPFSENALSNEADNQYCCDKVHGVTSYVNRSTRGSKPLCQ